MAGRVEIKLWIMSWGSRILVVEPESLRDKVRTEAEILTEQV